MTNAKEALHILDETQSICPVCKRPVKAFYAVYEEDNEQQENTCCSASAEAADSCGCSCEDDNEDTGCCCGETEISCCSTGGSDEPCCCTGESGTDQDTCCCGDTGASDCCGDADYNGRVYFVKECPEHGIFRTTAAEDAQDYLRWVRNPVINISPEKAMTSGDPDDMECPLHCGTCENHLQTACCVLIDLTDRCNQHCPYCFAKAEEDADRSSEPSLDELEAKFDLLIELGEERPFNIQLSGGEPTVREDLPEIIRMARDKGFEYIQINTNGRKLALEDGYAQLLKDAGATVIFMQFDGTRDDIYEKLRGEPLLEIKKRAIRNCEKADLAVTLVPTMVEGVNMDDIGNMMDFLIENVNVVKGIHFQPVSFFGRHPEKVSSGDCCSQIHSGDFPGRVTMFGLLHELEKQSPAFRYDDFCPIATGHTLCCFYGTYTKERDGSIRSALTASQREKGVSCCDAEGSYDVAGGDCCCGGDVAAQDEQKGISCCDMTSADKLEVIRKDRDYVLNKWEIADPGADEPCCCSGTAETEDCCCSEPEESESSCCCGDGGDEIMDIDEFLRYYRRNTFTVTGMAFQDITNLDAERVKRCRVQVLSPDNRLIPFCAYNTIYRK